MDFSCSVALEEVDIGLVASPRNTDFGCLFCTLSSLSLSVEGASIVFCSFNSRRPLGTYMPGFLVFDVDNF